MKWKYKAVMFLTLLIFCVGSVCATEPDNNITINHVSVNGSSDLTDTVNNTDLDRAVNPHVKTDLNFTNTNFNSSYNLTNKSFKNSNISDLMNNTDDINLLINKLNSSDENILIDTLSIKDIMNNLFKDNGVINLTSTIDYINHVLNYDIVQMRITLKTVKEYLINIDTNNLKSNPNIYLKPFMLGLNNKLSKLSVLSAFVDVLSDYFKTNIKPNQNLKDVNDTNVTYIITPNIKHHIKQLTHMIAYLNIMERFLKSINNDLTLINNEMKRV
ncbi:MAG: hypothetical protein MJ224_05305 [archaeon]|nr:hypothetical protein [archaeon]